jgi:hypothetical protein
VKIKELAPLLLELKELENEKVRLEWQKNNPSRFQSILPREYQRRIRKIRYRIKEIENIDLAD